MSTSSFLFGIVGIYICFLSWGILQERVSTTNYYQYDDYLEQHPKKYKFFIFLNFMQASCAFLCSFLYLRILGHKSIENLNFAYFKMFGKVAFLRSIASPFGYEALKYIDYPTIILGKSCKIIPVMIMAFILHGKVFEYYKYLSAGFITGGVSLFMLSQSGKASKITSSVYGILLLIINLLLDGAFNSSQDEIFKKFKISGIYFLLLLGPQMMFFMNLFSSLFMIIYMVFISPLLGESEFFEAIGFLMTRSSVLTDVLLLSLCGAAGEIFIFFTLENFGSVVLVTINVTRKMFSMLLSVFFFNHKLSFGQWIGVSLVFFGIFLESYASKKIKSDKVLHEEKVKLEKTK